MHRMRSGDEIRYICGDVVWRCVYVCCDSGVVCDMV